MDDTTVVRATSLMDDANIIDRMVAEAESTRSRIIADLTERELRAREADAARREVVKRVAQAFTDARNRVYNALPTAKQHSGGFTTLELRAETDFSGPNPRLLITGVWGGLHARFTFFMDGTIELYENDLTTKLANLEECYAALGRMIGQEHPDVRECQDNLINLRRSGIVVPE